MKKTIHVVDGFYSEPERVRSLALSRDDWLVHDPDGTPYLSPETAVGFFTDSVIDRLKGVVGAPIRVDPRHMGFGVFSYYGAAADVATSTHFDDSDWSAIVYLVPDQHCTGGLTFYRHAATGLDGPPSPKDLARLGCRSARQFLEEIYYSAKLRPEAWIATGHVAMRFNRAIVLRGSRLFHRASSGFGRGPADGRLTQRFFFNEDSGGNGGQTDCR